MISKDQLVVVIRSAGERTEQLCKKLLSGILDESQIFIIREYPFESVLRKSFQIGIDSKSKWLFVVDADLLILPETLVNVLDEANSEPVEIFHIQGIIYDKFFQDYRKAGPRLYRVNSLQRAIELIPKDREEIRPEFSTIKRMEAESYKSKSSDIVFGVHDFEQYYTDIYRKCVVHAFKHRDEIDKLIKKWITNIDDDDYKIALGACLDAFSLYESVSIDKRLFEARGQQFLNRIGTPEKNDLFDVVKIEEYVRSILSFAGDIPDYMTIKNDQKEYPTKKEFVKTILETRGILGTARYLLGQSIVKIGTFIRD